MVSVGQNRQQLSCVVQIWVSLEGAVRMAARATIFED